MPFKVQKLKWVRQPSVKKQTRAGRAGRAVWLGAQTLRCSGRRAGLFQTSRRTLPREVLLSSNASAPSLCSSRPQSLPAAVRSETPGGGEALPHSAIRTPDGRSCLTQRASPRGVRWVRRPAHRPLILAAALRGFSPGSAGLRADVEMPRLHQTARQLVVVVVNGS